MGHPIGPECTNGARSVEADDTLRRMSPCMVTVNVGGSFGSARRRDGMLAWAEDAAQQQPLLVFAQEVPAQAWLDVWTGHGYQAVRGPDRGWQVRSALLAHRSVEVQREHHHRNRHYHGSYLATAVVTTQRGPALVVSAHASPNEARPAEHGWDGPLPRARDGGGDPRYVGGRLWTPTSCWRH